MKFWAKLDDDNIVIEIIEETSEEDLEGKLSPNTLLGMTADQKQGLVRAFAPDQGPPGSYAAPGFKYDRDLKGFVPPQPSPDDIFDKKTFEWRPPKPDDEKEYVWDNESGIWVAA